MGEYTIERKEYARGAYLVRTIAIRGLSDKTEGNATLYQKILRYFLRKGFLLGNDFAKHYTGDGGTCVYSQSRDWLHMENATVKLIDGWHRQSGTIDIEVTAVCKGQLADPLNKTLESLIRFLP
jgi:hypothetical protein